MRTLITTPPVSFTFCSPRPRLANYLPLCCQKEETQVVYSPTFVHAWLEVARVAVVWALYRETMLKSIRLVQILFVANFNIMYSLHIIQIRCPTFCSA
ncbi:hypothetical protein M413DRAFT_247939 [Hebeloma cylindrosporum]|uniref:Uncharacterized protein n=1 Tax=Hebeloma cylindrosporum TaxID=76867 RepID=A0A0C2XKD1_HEBCY|nr:hypothetical protein M413DRAFT_247939 [Hebeloma cylindrosporum h7]